LIYENELHFLNSDDYHKPNNLNLFQILNISNSSINHVQDSIQEQIREYEEENKSIKFVFCNLYYMILYL
jgi:hypothetical protein